MAKNLRQVIRNLISESTEEIFSKLTENEIEMYQETNSIPKFNENGI